MDALECIKTRRSNRTFLTDQVPDDVIRDILNCGRLAPSGMNLQPWRVFVISDSEFKKKCAKCTKYSNLLQNAPHILLIFMDLSTGYDRVKSIQGIGAFFENTLLSIHAHGLGAVWIGEILNQREMVHRLLDISSLSFELMGAIAFGTPKNSKSVNNSPTRKPLDELILGWK